jgi:integrase
MATAGLRINDLMNLCQCDVEGRILRMRQHGSYRPKSGGKEEVAVIPSTVAIRLAKYLEWRKDKDLLIPVAEMSIYDAMRTHGKRLGIKISNHSLRKWVASFWERKGETGMVQFVLRHHPSKLRDRYVAPLTVEECH